MNRIPRLHAVALATGLLAAATAHAQQTAADPKLDVVVVTGIRAGIETSSAIRRATSTASRPRTSASSPTPTWPNRCSACPAW